jgi:Zn-finger nucleic acid-binding protein
VGSVTLDECTRCGGLWVDSRSFRRICEETEEQTMVLTADPPREATLDVSRPTRYWPCPECRRLMHRQNFARVSGVIVDTCKGHGVWFNEGELRRIVEFIRDGGLERARAREKADLEDARARLRSAKIDARLAASRLGGLHDGASDDSGSLAILAAVRGFVDWID